ncbi:MAG: glycosyltransferase, partial [Nitriliruptoraceae bacterium]
IVDHVIVVDDSSRDNTAAIAGGLKKTQLHIHSRNQGYGANQKTCYRAALAAGWLLGGTVGIGTVWFALGVGPAVSVALPRLRASWHPDRAGTSGGPAPS